MSRVFVATETALPLLAADGLPTASSSTERTSLSFTVPLLIGQVTVVVVLSWATARLPWARWG